MKKLIFIIIAILLTSISFSQKEFSESYIKMYDSNINKWTDCNVIVTYNLGDDVLLFKVYANNEPLFIVKRISLYFEGELEGGIKYTAFRVKNIEDTEEMIIQKFDEYKYGVRFIFNDGRTMQFTK